MIEPATFDLAQHILTERGETNPELIYSIRPARVLAAGRHAQAARTHPEESALGAAPHHANRTAY
ncbi:hypothetical protein [Pseudofrankia sp. BMG5.36]|uniref:hypothetical protein n=1 Tax=Pseudofrankia sp. BMG5.36 TaxID=1834512 RepID=UPI0008D9B3BB|nr:hypothetical protein [Pseudofrankia sp. BMG5.36]OHV56393.1 hypothetical protein BCD48_07845 [Pseudofrankia sp. BMG5.36]